MHVMTSLVILALFACVVVHAKYQHIPYPEYGPDLGTHAYCGRRVGEQCCAGRNDYCTVPILDTVCYCDIFCNRTVADCCPDFWELCIGIEPPPGALTPPPTTALKKKPKKDHCVHNGVLHQPGATIKINCNNCSCIAVPENGEYNWNCTQEVCLIREEIINDVNGRPELGWEASNYTFLWGKTLAEGIKYRLGTFKPTGPVRNMSSIRFLADSSLPAEFDSRLHWPGLIHEVRDQGDCGSSWALSTVDVASDRLSIHSLGRYTEALSAQHILSCDFDNNQGCSGGHVDRAWWYLRRSGVVSEYCYPYTSGDTGNRGNCLIARRRYRLSNTFVPCPSGGGDSRLYQSTPPYRISGEQDIMKEILKNGPVQAVMEVGEDFFMYRGGVYRSSLPPEQQPGDRQKGFHAVKIIGWGTDYSGGVPTKYWLVSNSWGRQWGEDGYFRILRGVGEGNIESFVVGAWAKVSGRQVINRFTPSQDITDDRLPSGSSGYSGNKVDIFSGNQDQSGFSGNQVVIDNNYLGNPGPAINSGYSGNQIDLGNSGNSYSGNQIDLNSGYSGSQVDLGNSYSGNQVDVGHSNSGEQVDNNSGYSGNQVESGNGYSGNQIDLGNGASGNQGENDDSESQVEIVEVPSGSEIDLGDNDDESGNELDQESGLSGHEIDLGNGYSGNQVESGGSQTEVDIPDSGSGSAGEAEVAVFPNSGSESAQPGDEISGEYLGLHDGRSDLS